MIPLQSTFDLSIALSSACFCLVFLYVARRVIHIYKSPLCLLRGPPNAHRIFGNIQQIGKVQDSRVLDNWIEQYGPSCLTRWLLSIPCLWTSDPRTVNHILTHSYDYLKPWEATSPLTRLFGPSILISERDTHKKQRRVLIPAFGTAQVRDLTDIFIEETTALRDYWKEQIIAQGGCLKTDANATVGKSTLDIIGIAGFDYRFNALNPTSKPNELYEAFCVLFKTPIPLTFGRILGDVFPFIKRYSDERAKKAADAQDTMRRVGMQLINNKKAEIMGAAGEAASGVEKKDVIGRDLLTLLIKANMAVDIPDSHRLSDEEVLSQVITFLVAGHETITTAISWALFALTQAPEIQRTLRDELHSISVSPTMDELTALPYLDAFVRESMRLYPPASATLRMATRDDVLPISQLFTDIHGKIQNELRIAKGNRIVLPISAINRLKSIWGEDAHVFRPERWQNPPEAVASLPGVWSHNLTFLSGPRSCIAWRFSVVEMKSFLFTLVREFEFELAVPADEIVSVGTLVQRPNVRSDIAKGAQMPLLIRLYAHE